MGVHPLHGIWSEKSLESFVGQLFLGHNLYDVFIAPIGPNDTVIFEREELGFFPVFPEGGKDRPWRCCGRPQSKIRGVKMGGVGGDYRRDDGLVWSFRDLDGQRLW